jgi:hypothetical protein
MRAAAVDFTPAVVAVVFTPAARALGRMMGAWTRSRSTT